MARRAPDSGKYLGVGMTVTVTLRDTPVVTRPGIDGYSVAMADDDRALALAAAGGDSRAFAQLVDRHHEGCVRYATRMLGSLEDAEDVVQDVFLRVWRALPRYDERAPFRPWLYTILVNRCRSRSVPIARHVRRSVALDDLPMELRQPDPASVLDREALDAALAVLPKDQREAFLLKHVEDLDYDTMTQLTGAGISALKMRVKRACATLRERLSP